MSVADDRDVAAAFRALRESDAVRRPSFEGILERPQAPARAASVVRRAALVAALVGLLAASAVVVVRARAPHPAAESLWAWRSPTRALLPAAPGASAVPRLGETWGAAAPKGLEEPR